MKMLLLSLWQSKSSHQVLETDGRLSLATSVLSKKKPSPRLRTSKSKTKNKLRPERRKSKI